MDFEDEEKKKQWNLKKYILLRVLLSAFMNDAIFWDVKRLEFIDISKETVAEFCTLKKEAITTISPKFS